MGKPGSIMGRPATVNIGLSCLPEPLEAFGHPRVNSGICRAISAIIKKFVACDPGHFDYEIKEYFDMSL